MDKTSTKNYKGATESIFQKLDVRGAILTVPRDRVKISKPQDRQSAIGIRDLNGCSCLVLMGTSPKSAIITAHISASNGEENYMSLLRQMIGIFIQEQDLFQLPIAFGIFSHNHNVGFPLNHLAERTSRVFQHLHVKLQVSLYNSYAAVAYQPLLGKHTVVAVRHEDGLPEVYIENRLLYPRIHSGCLALELDRLGLKQIDREHGDDEEEEDDTIKIGEKESGVDGCCGVVLEECDDKRKRIAMAPVGSGYREENPASAEKAHLPRVRKNCLVVKA